MHLLNAALLAVGYAGHVLSAGREDLLAVRERHLSLGRPLPTQNIVCKRAGPRAKNYGNWFMARGSYEMKQSQQEQPDENVYGEKPEAMHLANFQQSIKEHNVFNSSICESEKRGVDRR